jgi:DNA-binding response OmpR family regulator
MPAHILLAVRDDEREIIHSILRQKTHQITVASSIESALSALESEIHQLALIDEDFLAAGEGRTLAEDIRHRFGPSLVILMLVRGSYRDYFDSGDLWSTVDWIMHYPVSDEEILGNIERYLRTQ